MSPKTFIHTPENFNAGNIANRFEHWACITKEKAVLQTVTGIHIELINSLSQERVPFPFRLDESERSAIDIQIQKFLQKGIIREAAREEGEFISNIFSRPKSDG